MAYLVNILIDNDMIWSKEKDLLILQTELKLKTFWDLSVLFWQIDLFQ